MKILIAFAGSIILAASGKAQDVSKALMEMDRKLISGKLNNNNILSDPAYNNFHSLTTFRQLIKKYATTAPLTIITPNEPGIPMTVKGFINNKSGKPVKDLLIYFYQTDQKGWYADTAGHIRMMEGDRRHARLFGYLRTGANGAFEFKTIHPNGYPDSDLPQHIHFEIYDGENALLITELLFDDDARLTSAVKKRYLSEGAYISTNTGSDRRQIYIYRIKI